MTTFIEWRAAQQTKTDAKRIQLMRTGETETIKPVREKLERYVNALAEYVAKEQIPPLGEGPDRIHLMPFRTQNECGWAIEMFPFVERHAS